MALDTELRATTYAGNGSTALAYPILFPYLDPADIKVQVQAVGAATPTVLAESAYTVHDEDDGAPYVTTTAAYPSTTTVQIFRFMDYLQPLVLPEGGKLSSVTLETALDRLTMLAMQGGDGGYSLPSAGSRDSAIFADAGTRSVTAASRVGQLGVQLDNGSVWRALSTYAGDWQEIMPAIRSNERNVHTQAQLIAAFAESSALTIYVRKDIDLSVSVTMEANKTLVMGDYRFTQIGASTLILMGAVVADRKQIFSGFTAGQVSGSFGQEAVFPEWWGLVDNLHDVAINCAVQAGRISTSLTGLKISLAARTYDVSAPIDLSGKAITLEGAGSQLTFLRATSAWDATWVKAEFWGAPTDPVNHAAMVWIGSNLGLGTTMSFWTKVKGMTIHCYYAGFPYRVAGLKRVSGISSKGYVEECSVIHDVAVEYSTGFGIGFCRHKAPADDWSGGVTGSAVVNGLSIRDFWITGRTFRDAYPLYFSAFTNNCSVDTGTIDMTMIKSISSAWNVAPADPEPEWVVTYPLIGITAQGGISISNVHIEGPVIGVHVEQNNGGGNSVSLTNLTFWQLQDPIRGALYYEDGLSGVDFANEAAVTAANLMTGTNSNDVPRYFGYGCGVLIAKGYLLTGTTSIPRNTKDRVTISGIRSIGGTTYLLRDEMYGKNIRTFGMGASPAQLTSTGIISFYSRGNPYAWSTTLPYTAITPGGGAYDPANPTTAASTSRTFFVGPIY